MESSGTRSEQRIDELEARLAEQDRSILELSDERSTANKGRSQSSKPRCNASLSA